jgi:hypothetical protein
MNMLRSHEVMDYKRCPKKWYWKWRRGLVSKLITFGALDLGTWAHEALAAWYRRGRSRNGNLVDHFERFAHESMELAYNDGAPEYVLDKADELAMLGVEMMKAYQAHYGLDPDVHVIAPEVPSAFEITDDEGKPITTYKMKLDLVYRDKEGNVRLMEHKTAAQIRTGHLPIDGQARPYGALAERALKRAGILKKDDVLTGVTYNFLRKALPDERPKDAEGKALNKDGSVSARQPAANFLRFPVRLTRAAKLVTLKRIQADATIITMVADYIRKGELDTSKLPKTPDKSCPMTCQFFDMCVAEENGTPIADMERNLFTVQNPYDYGDTTDDPAGFDM